MTARRARRSHVWSRRTVDSSARWCATWLTSTTSTDFSRNGGAPAQATAHGTPPASARRAATGLRSSPTGTRRTPRRCSPANGGARQVAEPGAEVGEGERRARGHARRGRERVRAARPPRRRTTGWRGRCSGATRRPWPDRRPDRRAARRRPGSGRAVPWRSREGGVTAAVVEQRVAVPAVAAGDAPDDDACGRRRDTRRSARTRCAPGRRRGRSGRRGPRDSRCPRSGRRAGRRTGARAPPGRSPGCSPRTRAPRRSGRAGPPCGRRRPRPAAAPATPRPGCSRSCPRAGPPGRAP